MIMMYRLSESCLYYYILSLFSHIDVSCEMYGKSVVIVFELQGNIKQYRKNYSPRARTFNSQRHRVFFFIPVFFYTSLSLALELVVVCVYTGFVGTNTATLCNSSGAAAAFTSFRFPIARGSCVLGRMYIYVRCTLCVYIIIYTFFFYYSQCTPFARRHAHSPAMLPRRASVPRSRYIMTLRLPEWQPLGEGKSYRWGHRSSHQEIFFFSHFLYM